LNSEIDAFVGLGANLDDRAASIHSAIALLDKANGVRVVRASPLIENPAIGGPPDSPPFLNAAAQIATTLPPRVLLERLLAIEAMLGRVRRTRWEPRIIDLDLLMYGNTILNEPGMVLPHPRLHERRFVLLPLSQIAPQAIHPTLGKTILSLLDELPRNP